MKQLSGLDATFLYLEKPEMPMHVGAMHLLELPAGYRGRYVNDLRHHIAARLPAAPVLRRRLWWMPLNLANPAWVDADPDLAEHIVEIRLPRGSTAGADVRSLMEAQVSRLHPVLLDRHRPLWRMHVIEGLPRTAEGHRQVGVYTQLHHAAVDGQAAVALANVLFDLTPVPRQLEIRPSSRTRTFRLDMMEMLRDALGNEVSQVTRIVRELPATLGTVVGTAKSALRLDTLLGKGSGNVTLAPATPMNVTVTPARAFAAVSLPLAELKTLAHAHGATLNDLVLMLCAGALRSYLQHRGALPRKSLVAAVPISLREAGDTRADNQASMSLVSLGTHLADPAKRLRHITRATAAMKSTMGRMKRILPTDYPSIGVPWLIEAAASLYGKARVAERLPQVANLVISNVPGPQVPLYLAGARVQSNHPTSIVVHGLALNITVQSFDASMDFGLMADAAALPDLRRLAQEVEAAMEELRGLPLPGARKRARPVSPKRPRTGDDAHQKPAPGR
ncbi:MAG TPA: wax ester/triacylglycerol synthase family O-acyltransferase [Hydrogenophaga sp.]|uniref:wax ester/triacylglycerol synthase family O-acyltransferase n=1 Tax=Hydrogenophaga sp. TaxID=1904254 RepID=UPI002BC7E986|nr:wax ester/triacylglycerol synthase family O-acyltransferase [Hydrogenophaga sp.]HMN93167.1 wax ester/triacylglycerol synthase family O-acyltransferase [Hydrogenophaga sp.]HMP10146.1 wax ester/triacylglycerol synthase family O-acyltransferase [Hydrogenophaga sp.]